MGIHYVNREPVAQPVLVVADTAPAPEPKRTDVVADTAPAPKPKRIDVLALMAGRPA